MNPSENKPDANFSEYCRDFLKSLILDEPEKFYRLDKTIRTSRMTLKYVSDQFGFKIKTRVDFNGVLWVMRIACEIEK